MVKGNCPKCGKVGYQIIIIKAQPSGRYMRYDHYLDESYRDSKGKIQHKFQRCWIGRVFSTEEAMAKMDMEVPGKDMDNNNLLPKKENKLVVKERSIRRGPKHQLKFTGKSLREDLHILISHYKEKSNKYAGFSHAHKPCLKMLETLLYKNYHNTTNLYCSCDGDSKGKKPFPLEVNEIVE
jgi:hypothetical protein